MGVSIYCTASRPLPLTAPEKKTIDEILARYSVESLLAGCGIPESDFDGEDFDVYPSSSTTPGTVFEGSSKLPLGSEEAMWSTMQYWCRLLSEVRLVIPDASWRVHVDDYDIPWIEEQQAFVSPI
jgi:hypothetical protein